MRFLIDECVDARLVGILHRRGHEAFTVPNLNQSSAEDDDVSVYADDRGAVLVTDDRELITRRRAHLFVNVLDLRGPKTAAVALVHNRIDEIVEVFEAAREPVVVAASVKGVRVTAPPWLRA